MSAATKQTNTDETSLMEKLFSTGGHFGFAKSRRHPTVAPYIFGNKQGTDIIDLEATIALLEKAKQFLRETGKSGKTILFVGTKEEIAPVVAEYAARIEAPVMVNRWVGGTLTNFSEVKKRIQRLTELTQKGESGELERRYTKKERVLLGRELNKLMYNFSGIKDMDRLPHALLVVDPRHNHIAVSEAECLNIPVIGITNSDTDLSPITFPIVVNDSLRSCVSLVLQELVSAYEEGKKEFTPTSETTNKKKHAKAEGAE